MRCQCFVFVALLSIWTASAGNVDYDSFVDKIVSDVKQVLLKQNKTTVDLPDTTKSFTERFLLIPIPTTISIRGETLGDLTTLRRRGPATATVDSQHNVLTVTSSFSFDSLIVNVKDFNEPGITVKFGFYHNAWQYVIFGDNTFTLSIHVHTNGPNNCSSELGIARVVRLGDLQVSDIDTGFFSSTTERFEDIVLNWFAPDIENAVNTHVRPVATEVVAALSSVICALVN